MFRDDWYGWTSPHLLSRFFTTPTVAETRKSVAWSLFFIALLYLAAPALAVREVRGA